MISGYEIFRRLRALALPLPHGTAITLHPTAHCDLLKIGRQVLQDNDYEEPVARWASAWRNGDTSRLGKLFEVEFRFSPHGLRLDWSN